MSAGTATRSCFQGTERPAETRSQRKSVAIGDLHGDYNRLKRILREEGILIEGTSAWNPEACNVDLILIGDYVDWRNEPLEEEDPEQRAEGARRVLELLHGLHKDVRRLRAQYDDFDGRIYALRGNHDDMMLDALHVLEHFSLDELEGLARNFHSVIMRMRATMQSMGRGEQANETFMKFVNWYVQGGKATLEGWGSMQAWRQAMEGELGDWLRNDLHLGAVVNGRLYAHTAPDLQEFWRPIAELQALPPADQARMRESFLWSRKLWGFDFYSGCRTEPLTEPEIDRMLAGLGVRGVVVGHTPVTTERDPYIAYDGKVINIDLHGIPQSHAFVETYDVDPSTVRGAGSKHGPPEIVLRTFVSTPRPERPEQPARRRKRKRTASASAKSTATTKSETTAHPESATTSEP